MFHNKNKQTNKKDKKFRFFFQNRNVLLFFFSFFSFFFFFFFFLNSVGLNFLLYKVEFHSNNVKGHLS
jgi:hypothetical protein